MSATPARGHRRPAGYLLLTAILGLTISACSSSLPATPRTTPRTTSATTSASVPATAPPRTQLRSSAGRTVTSTTPGRSAATPEPAGEFTVAFAGDVHFSGRVRARLDADPATVFGAAQPGLARADLTMVNLETAITTRGVAQAKAFTFRAPPTAFKALRDAGIDVATMANNHGADFGATGVRDSLAAARAAHFPVVGIGGDAAAAFAPYTTTLNGIRVAIIAADQVQDETTLRLFSAGPHTAGVANAFSPLLLDSVRRARAAGYVVIVYVHWGVEYTTCPSGLQTSLAGQLSRAGAGAVIGTHAHVLQGAGWRPDGTYVEYGLGNYLWWMSFGNDQDDNGVLTLTFRDGRVHAESFAASHLDGRGVPVPSTGAQRRRIDAEWDADRLCADLSATPPS